MLRPAIVTARISGLSRAPRAGRAGHVAHVALVLVARPVRLGVGVPALDPLHHALEAGVVGPLPPVLVAVAHVHLVLGAVQDLLLRPLARSCATGCRGRSPRGRRAPPAGAGSTPGCGRSTTAGSRPRAGSRSGSGTISSGSTSFFVPRPVHSGQAPYGALKENDRGSRSSIASGWSLGQARCSENLRSRCSSSSGRSTKSSSTMPEASLSAVSIESVRRCLALALTESRSTTTSMVCFSCFLSFGGSVSGCTTPSTRARAKPLDCSSAKRSTYSPLRPAHHRREHLEPGALVHRQHPVDDLLRGLPGDRRSRRPGSAARRPGRRAAAGSRRPR